MSIQIYTHPGKEILIGRLKGFQRFCLSDELVTVVWHQSLHLTTSISQCLSDRYYMLQSSTIKAY